MCVCVFYFHHMKQTTTSYNKLQQPTISDLFLVLVLDNNLRWKNGIPCGETPQIQTSQAVGPLGPFPSVPLIHARTDRLCVDVPGTAGFPPEDPRSPKRKPRLRDSQVVGNNGKLANENN